MANTLLTMTKYGYALTKALATMGGVDDKRGDVCGFVTNDGFNGPCSVNLALNGVCWEVSMGASSDCRGKSNVGLLIRRN
jgi:hypothetical protein